MDFEKDEFEEELENESAGNFELKLQKEEDFIDKSGIKRLKKFPKKVNYGLKVDLKNKIVRFNVYMPKIQLEEPTEVEKEKGCKLKEVLVFDKILVFKKNYIFKDNTIFIETMSYKIPKFFNSELIAKNDLDTWERIFYGIFSNEIRIETEKYNEQLKRNKQDE